MLLAGDEHGHTQHGNNNAYAQDNELSWLNWQDITPSGHKLRAFTQELIAVRKAYPILHRGRFLRGVCNEKFGVKDVTWLNPAGAEMSLAHWTDARARCFGMLLDGRAQPTGIRRRGADATLLIVFNAHSDVVEFTLPEVPEGRRWTGLIDTNDPLRTDLPTFEFGRVYMVTGRSLLVFGCSALGLERTQSEKSPTW